MALNLAILWDKQVITNKDRSRAFSRVVSSCLLVLLSVSTENPLIFSFFLKRMPIQVLI